jgi:hypothetical protein
MADFKAAWGTSAGHRNTFDRGGRWTPIKHQSRTVISIDFTNSAVVPHAAIDHTKSVNATVAPL